MGECSKFVLRDFFPVLLRLYAKFQPSPICVVKKFVVVDDGWWWWVVVVGGVETIYSVKL